MLLAPGLLLLVAVAVPWGCGGGGKPGPTPTPVMGGVVVGLVDSPSSAFQRVVLNVVSVRMNPSADAGVAESDPNWVTIPITQVLTGAVGELQVDVLTLQNNMKLLSEAPVAAQTYQQFELQVDPTTPGLVVPNCASSANPPTEGCVTFPVFIGSSLRATGNV